MPCVRYVVSFAAMIIHGRRTSVRDGRDTTETRHARHHGGVAHAGRLCGRPWLQTICRMYMNDCGKPKMSGVGCPTCYLARYPHNAVHRG